MYMAVEVRYHFVWGPKRPKSVRYRWWPDLGYKYLRAIMQAGYDVRAIPIGFAHFQVLNEKPWKHWKKVYEAFASSRATTAGVNIVCAPLGFTMGRTVRLKDLAPQSIDGVPGFLTANNTSDPEQVVYEPSTAIAGLWTEGFRNVAITGTVASDVTASDLEASRRYDLVLTPTQREVEQLKRLGVSAQSCTPREVEKCLLDG